MLSIEAIAKEGDADEASAVPTGDTEGIITNNYIDAGRGFK